MAGHSKWANIKHKKAKEDAKRGQAFTKLTREITVCAREGGGDPAGNMRLRFLMEKAKAINMPLENTLRAVKKGTGELPGVSYEAFTYEGYGPHGIAVILDVLTDNKNRIAGDLRHVFTKHNGSLGETGSVNWMFEKSGVVRVVDTNATEDQLFDLLLDFDINNIEHDEGFFVVQCAVKDLDKVRKTLADAKLTIENAQLEWVAKTMTSLSEEQSEKAYEFLSALDDLDDVQNVFTNLA
jgi:YebC/PmpR family DNA-binding regulatory protein